MLKDFNYIAFDFETTGVDFNKDEPIQLGILQFDKDFKIKNKFQTYIKPRKDLKELKNIVGFLTGISLDDLKNAPYFEDILPAIMGFFDENTVVIGHNVNFDITFMNKLYDISFTKSFDTFNTAKVLMHFVPSYALEILNEILNDKGDKTNLAKILGLQPGENLYHDALYDSAISYRLFKYLVNILEDLFKKYPVLVELVKKSDSIYKDIFDLDSFLSKKTLSLPKLSKDIKADSKVYNKDSKDLSVYKDKEKLYIGDTPFKQVLSKLLYRDQKVILSFSHRSKMDMAKKIFAQLGVKNLGYFRQDVVFDDNNIKKFVSKKKFRDFEIDFIIKYFSHFDKGIGFLNLNSKQDYMIMEFLTNKTDKKFADIVLSNHGVLLDAIKNGRDISSHTILFFDWDMWYNSFSKYLNSPVNLYDFINYIENLVYSYYFEDKPTYDTVVGFYNRMLIFIGVLFTEIKHKFIDVQDDKLEIPPIHENLDFYRTNDLLYNFEENVKKVKQVLIGQDALDFQAWIDKIQEILQEVVVLERKTEGNEDFYFIFHKTNNVINYSEFLNFFGESRVLFLSNSTQEKAVMFEQSSVSSHSENFVKILQEYQAILQAIQQNKSIFILSSARLKSKELFEKLYTDGIHNEYEIFVENITGGVGKNVFYAKRKEKKIVIGGYEFFMALSAEEVNFDQIIVYHAFGPLQDQIIADMKYYNIN